MPFSMPSIKSEKTFSLYSLEKFTTSISIPIFSATETASIKSCLLEQYSSSSSSSQFFINKAVTLKPSSFRSHAVTAESTPPERPTIIFLLINIYSLPISLARLNEASVARIIIFLKLFSFKVLIPCSVVPPLEVTFFIKLSRSARLCSDNSVDPCRVV